MPRSILAALLARAGRRRRRSRSRLPPRGRWRRSGARAPGALAACLGRVRTARPPRPRARSCPSRVGRRAAARSTARRRSARLRRSPSASAVARRPAARPARRRREVVTRRATATSTTPSTPSSWTASSAAADDRHAACHRAVERRSLRRARSRRGAPTHERNHPVPVKRCLLVLSLRRSRLAALRRGGRRPGPARPARAAARQRRRPAGAAGDGAGVRPARHAGGGPGRGHRAGAAQRRHRGAQPRQAHVLGRRSPARPTARVSVTRAGR